MWYYIQIYNEDGDFISDAELSLLQLTDEIGTLPHGYTIKVSKVK